MIPKTIGFTEAKAKLSLTTTEVNRTGRPILVIKNNRPWVTISPAVKTASKQSPCTAFGCLSQYADPAKRRMENGAWKAAVLDKHALR